MAFREKKWGFAYKILCIVYLNIKNFMINEKKLQKKKKTKQNETISIVYIKIR